jgi:hypothetical protein
MSWRILALHASEQVGSNPEALAMEIDPRSSVIRLGIVALGATTQEADGGAVLLRYLPGEQVNWRPIITWLEGPQAAEHLQQISQGYTAEQRWSGDWQATWSESAWTAASALHHAVTTLLAQGH